MYRFEQCIKEEIIKHIQIWTEKEMSHEDAEIYFEDCCSIWNSIYELKYYLEEDGEIIDLNELAKEDWVVFLSNGDVMMLG